jgi:PhnB protein
MTQLNAYLNFNGNCREAMTFYKECLGGELNMQTIGESPVANQMPKEARQNILHSTLIKDGSTLLMASDMIGAALVMGNAISLCLNCSSEEEIKSCFSRLSSGGEIKDPLGEKFWGDTFGALIDKFGINWLLNYHKKPQA